MEEDRLGSRGARLAIAEKVRDFLDAKGHPRKFLVGQERHHLSEATINKFFQGQFSRRTLTMIEAILGISFSTQDDAAVTAPKELGGYTYSSVMHIEGDYLCVRPLFNNPTSLNAYVIAISWKRRQLEFSERSRADARYAMVGVVHVPFGTPFMYLTSINDGNVRLITLSKPDAGLSRGLISTLSNPAGTTLIPVASPIFLRRLKANEEPRCGIISLEDPCYEEYQRVLSSVIAEEFGIFVVNQNAADRRRGFAVVNP